MTIRWSRAANRDVTSTFSFLLTQSERAAVTVVSRITAAVGRLEKRPLVGRLGRLPDTRELVVPKTPYIVVYRTGVAEVLIVRVIHGARLWPPANDEGDGAPS